jgi:uncharacterized repeat protein (TIGR02543 family)
MRTILFLTITLFVGFFISCSTESTPVYQLTTHANPEEAGTVDPASGEFDEGSSVEITAEPNEHWVFVGWQGDHSGTQNPDSVTIQDDLSITALFEKREYPLTIHLEGDGSVDQEIISAKSTDYPHGTAVQLTAEPADGWEFSEWSGHLNSRENPETIDIAGETEITAHFERREFQLDIDTEGTGSVGSTLVSGTETEEGYLFESVVELTAQPENGWTFLNWDGDLDGSENPEQIIIDSDKEVRAVFEEQFFSLEVSAEGNGSVQVNPDKDQYGYNEEVTLQATPEDGWEFSGWSGALGGDQNPSVIMMDSDKQITATFEELCLDPEECVSIQFYASVRIGSFVHQSGLNIYNYLPDSIYLTGIRVRREDDSIIAQSDTIDEWIASGNGLSFSVSYQIPPSADEHGKFTVEADIEYEGSSLTITGNGASSSSKTKSISADDINYEDQEPGIRLIKP